MLRLTLLIDNTARSEGHIAQHGFSALCETGGSRILFDTGATGEILLRNSMAMRQDLADMSDVVLSHGHWDHGGGLVEALDACAAARVWIPAGSLMPRWSGAPGAERDIALSLEVRERLVMDRRRWSEVSRPTGLADGIWITGPVPGARPGWTHKGLLRNVILGIPDDVPEEQALVFDTATGLVVVVGCSHYGLANLLGLLETSFPGRNLRAIVGGMHLESAPPEVFEDLANRLLSMGVERVVPCHCSGPDAACRLSALGVPAEPGRVGWQAEF